MKFMKKIIVFVETRLSIQDFSVFTDENAWRRGEQFLADIVEKNFDDV